MLIPGYFWIAGLANWPCVTLGKTLRHKDAHTGSWKSVENSNGWSPRGLGRALTAPATGPIDLDQMLDRCPIPVEWRCV